MYRVIPRSNIRRVTQQSTKGPMRKERRVSSILSARSYLSEFEVSSKEITIFRKFKGK
jgi:hypothetical protein